MLQRLHSLCVGAVVTDLVGIDPDHDSHLTFQLQQAIGETPFAVIADSRLITHVLLDYEQVQSYVIMLTVLDEGDLSFSKVQVTCTRSSVVICCG